jgi:hypothetical protein
MKKLSSYYALLLAVKRKTVLRPGFNEAMVVSAREEASKWS